MTGFFNGQLRRELSLGQDVLMNLDRIMIPGLSHHTGIARFKAEKMGIPGVAGEVI